MEKTTVHNEQHQSRILERFATISRLISEELNFADNSKDCGYKNYDKLQLSLLKIWTLIFFQPEKEIWESVMGDCFDNEEQLRLFKDFISSLEAKHFWADSLQINPSLVGIHLRTPYVKKGRMSAALDQLLGNPKEFQQNPWLVHQSLLQVYFEIYGRHRTLNEFVFNRLSAEKRIEHSMLTVEFTEKGSEKDFLTVEVTTNKKKKFEKTIITISEALRQCLLPDTLQTSFYDKITEGSGGDNKRINEKFLDTWLPRLRLVKDQDTEYMINKLSECIENAYCTYTTPCSEYLDQWRKLFNYILLPERKITRELKWSQHSRTNAKDTLKALQGICLYQYFARSSITSLAFEEQDPGLGSVVGVTLGFNKSHPDHLFETLQEFFASFKDPILLKKRERPRKLPLCKPWDDLVVKEGISEMTSAKLATLCDQLQQLSFAKHEGTALRFTAYVGNQILMSKFRCISELDANSQGDGGVIEYYNINGWHTMIKSHYSLFMDGRTGLFFDEASNDHVALVHPLPFPEEITDDQQFNLDDYKNNTDRLGSSEYFLSFSHKCPNLALVSVDEGRLIIYYSGRAIIEISTRTDFKVQFLGGKTPIIDWSRSDVRSLLGQIFDDLNSELEAYKESAINALSTAICHVSDRQGYGGMIIFVKDSGRETPLTLQGMRTELNDKQISFWKEGHLYDHTSESLINMMIPDGSMLINLTDLKIENQIYIVPIEQGKLVQATPELGTGTRHRTAQGITTLNSVDKKIWSICISADGGISVYCEGRKKSPKDIRTSPK